METDRSPRPHHTRPLRPRKGPVPDLRQARAAQGDPQPPGPHHRLQAGRLPRRHLRRVPGPLRLLHDLPHHPAGRRAEGAVRQCGPPGRPRPHPRRRHERRAGHRLDAPGLPPGPLRRLRLRLPRLAGPAARPGRPSPLGPGPLQRHPLRRRAAPRPDDVAAGHRPAPGPAGGLRPGRQATTRTTCGGS